MEHISNYKPLTNYGDLFFPSTGPQKKPKRFSLIGRLISQLIYYWRRYHVFTYKVHKTTLVAYREGDTKRTSQAVISDPRSPLPLMLS